MNTRPAIFLELGLIGALSALYLVCFTVGSPVNAMHEIFDQDSFHILSALDEGRRYPWNPQHHILYHQLVEAGRRLWPGAPGDLESTYRFLKLFTAACGLGFLLAFRLLLRRMEIGAFGRIAAIGFAGLAIAAWGGFSTIETHCLALPFLTLFIAAVYRMLQTGRAGRSDRLLAIASLTLCALARIELAGVAVGTAAALALPGFRGLRRALAIDLLLVAVLSGTCTLWLATDYLDVSWRRAARRVVLRGDRATLRQHLMRTDNLAPGHLLRVGRAVGVYSVLMPVAGQERVMDIPDRAQIRYFSEPLRRMLERPVSGVSLVLVLALLGTTLLRALRHLARGDPFVAWIAILWIGGWLAYTWFNPFEPYLWIFPFHAMTTALIARTGRADGPAAWGAVAAVAIAVGLHNFQAFYLALR